MQFVPVIVVSKRDYPLEYKLVEHTFNRQTYLRRDVRNKQTVNATQDRQNNLFRNEEIICLRQADSTSRLCAKELNFDKVSSIK